jgi:hypothetical protein
MNCRCSGFGFLAVLLVVVYASSVFAAQRVFTTQGLEEIRAVASR